MTDKLTTVPWITKDQWRERFKTRLRNILRRTVKPEELDAEVERRFQKMMEMEVPSDEELVNRGY